MKNKFNKTYALHTDMQKHTIKPQSVPKVDSGLLKA